MHCGPFIPVFFAGYWIVRQYSLHQVAYVSSPFTYHIIFGAIGEILRDLIHTHKSPKWCNSGELIYLTLIGPHNNEIPISLYPASFCKLTIRPAKLKSGEKLDAKKHLRRQDRYRA
jgi:hypothetical protein